MRLTHSQQVWTAGQVIGIIHDIPTCSDLVNRIEQEAIESMSKTRALIVDKQPEPEIAGKPIGDTTSDPRTDTKTKAEAELWNVGKASKL